MFLISKEPLFLISKEPLFLISKVPLQATMEELERREEAATGKGSKRPAAASSSKVPLHSIHTYMYIYICIYIYIYIYTFCTGHVLHVQNCEVVPMRAHI